MHGFWSTPTSKLISIIIFISITLPIKLDPKIIAIFICQNNLYILQVEIDLGGRVEQAHPPAQALAHAQAEAQARHLHEEHEE